MQNSPKHSLLSNGRLLLRPFNDEDFDAVHEYATDPLVYEHAEWGPNSASDTREFLKDAQEQRAGRYSLAVTIDNALIGAAAVWTTNARYQVGELGYSFNSNYWGLGYGTAACALLVRLGFSELGLHRLEATCAPANHASRRILEKNGFRYEGLLRENKLVRGKRRDSLIFARLATD